MNLKIKSIVFMILICFNGLAYSDQNTSVSTEFNNRFGTFWNFSCRRTNHGLPITLGIGVLGNYSPGWKDYDFPKNLPPSEKAKLLSVNFFLGDHKFIFASWGAPQFDNTMKFMSIKLHDGKTVVFERFRDIPDQSEADDKPFFYVTVDNEPKLACGQYWRYN